MEISENPLLMTRIQNETIDIMRMVKTRFHFFIVKGKIAKIHNTGNRPWLIHLPNCNSIDNKYEPLLMLTVPRHPKETDVS
jgi:hypothetical protein